MIRILVVVFLSSSSSSSSVSVEFVDIHFSTKSFRFCDVGFHNFFFWGGGPVSNSCVVVVNWKKFGVFNVHQVFSRRERERENIL